MKSLRILFSVLFVMSFATTACDDGGKKTTAEICNDALDNDGDGRVDCYDTDCANDAACATNNVNAEICTNGVDDDNDGAIDCADTDCAANAACTTNECTVDTVFFDSPATCDAGFQCGVNETYAATCVADAQFAGGDFYGACGANGECPFGSICAGTSAADSTCMPFCQAETHPTCPEGGLCMYSLQNSTLNLCALPDNCDPVANTGCTTAGEGCYIVDQQGNSSCVPAGTMVAGDTCQYINDCSPGLLCNGTCIAMCDDAHPCAAGTCTSLGIPNSTIGACQ